LKFTDKTMETWIKSGEEEGNRAGEIATACGNGAGDRTHSGGAGLVSILIAEDSRTQAMALCYLLEQHHFEVVWTENGRDAMEKLLRCRPTLVITDINMPEVNGYDLCARIKKDDALRDLPVILLTTLSEPKDVLKGIQCGADSFVVKPYDENVLISRIEHLLASLPLKTTAPAGSNTEIVYDGQSYSIDTTRAHSVELLLSTYEVAVQRNNQLEEVQQQLQRQTEDLRKALVEATESHERLNEAQMQLIEAEKLRCVGRLAAAIAHEVKNPLGILQIGLDWLGRLPQLDNDGQTDGVLHDMKDAVERASLVIGDLLSLAAPRSLEIGEVCINALIEKGLRFVKHDFAIAKVRVTKALEADLPKCSVDPNKILQVFINIFVNASHAMPTGGTLSIKTSKRVMAADDAGYAASGASGPRYRSGDTVVDVQIRDTGTGIPEEHLEKLFDPFFTTKPAGQGTGLGLAVTKQIIDMHGAILDIRNADEGGAMVTITFTQTAARP
jgi:signal transduction histidine kinase